MKTDTIENSDELVDALFRHYGNKEIIMTQEDIPIVSGVMACETIGAQELIDLILEHVELKVLL